MSMTSDDSVRKTHVNSVQLELYNMNFVEQLAHNTI